MKYCIASFKSRNQIFGFDKLLKQANIRTEIINTPHRVAVGCSLSIRFSCNDFPKVKEVYSRTRPSSFVGFYLIDNDFGQVTVRRL